MLLSRRIEIQLVTMQITVFCSSLTRCSCSSAALSLQIKADKIEIWIYNLHVFRKVACLSSITSYIYVVHANSFRTRKFPVSVVSFDFHFSISEIHIFHHFYRAFSLSPLSSATSLSFPSFTKTKMFAHFYLVWHMLCHSHANWQQKTVQFIYCFTCSLYAY